MRKRIVAMARIPGRIQRGPNRRSSLDYSRYGVATWKWWCARNDVEFVEIDHIPGEPECEHMPPTIQRWFAPRFLLRECAPDSSIAMVDADTMIRWDAPDFLEMTHGSVAAVQGSSMHWIDSTIRAHQRFFPGVSLPWWEYFNSGMVVLGKKHLPILDCFTRFALDFWNELRPLQASADFGTDQTPLNFIVRREREPVHFLPRPFNLLHCFPISPALRNMERSSSPDWEFFAQRAFSRPGAFDFIRLGFIWHFSNIVAARAAVMEETWKRISKNYPSATL